MTCKGYQGSKKLTKLELNAQCTAGLKDALTNQPVTTETRTIKSGY